MLILTVGDTPSTDDQVFVCQLGSVVKVFKRNGGNDNKTEGGRDTAGSRGSRMVGIYIRKSYYIMYST